MIEDEKILISGVSGIVAQPLARFLAKSNEVWGIARFSDGGREIEQFSPATGETPIDRDLSPRQSLEATGITTRAVDMGAGDFSSLPDDFTYVLHFSWMRADLAHLEGALRTNVEGPGLLLQHCRKAKAALVMSGMGIYSPSEDPYHPTAKATRSDEGPPRTPRPVPRRSWAWRQSPASAPGPSISPS